MFFERSIDRSSSAGRWFGSAANLVQFYGGARIFSAGFKYLKSLSYLQGVFSEKYAVLRKWAYRGVLAGVGGLVGLQVYQARKSVYDATLLLINEQEKALEKFPRVKEWVRGELRAEGLVSDANEMIDTLTKEADLVEDIVIQSTQDQIVALYAKRAELSDPEAIAVIDKGIAIFKARLEERQALKKTRKAS